MRKESPMVPKQKKRKRRTFSPEFKSDVVRMCRSESTPDVSRRMGLIEKSVRLWVKQAPIDAGEGPPDALTTADRVEIRRLQRELKRVTEERDILKKATAFFARENS